MKDGKHSAIDVFFTGLVLFCAVAECSIIAVVVRNWRSMYLSLTDISFEKFFNVSQDTSSLLSSVMKGFGEAAETIVITFEHSLVTPRIPLSSELNCYGLANVSVSSTESVVVYASLSDFGGPSTALYFADRYNASTLSALVQHLFWRTGGLGLLLKGTFDTWNGIILNTLITLGSFTLSYPFRPLNESAALPINSSLTSDSTRLWANPYFDQVTRQWLTALTFPVQDVSEQATTGEAIFHCTVLPFIDYASSRIALNGSYIVVASSNGSLLHIPDMGGTDWAPEIKNFNYQSVCQSQDYNTTRWNFLLNDVYLPLAEAMCHGAESVPGCHILGEGDAEVVFSGSFIPKYVSWDIVPQPGWIVIVVSDQTLTLEAKGSAKRQTMSLSIIVLSIGAMSFLSVCIYVGIKIHLLGMANKIADLNDQLNQVMMQQPSNSTTDTAIYETDTHILAGHTEKIIGTLQTICKDLDEDEEKKVREAIDLLVHRNFTDLTSISSLSDKQKQWVQDCGMEVGELSREIPQLHTVAQSMDEDMQYNEERVSIVTSLSRSINLNQWEFDVFSLVKTCGRYSPEDISQLGLLPVITLAILREWRLGPETGIEIDIGKLLQFSSTLDASYCYSEKMSGTRDATEENPFHNRLHAADVTQCMFFLIRTISNSTRFRDTFRPIDRLACLVASLVHDFGHPGRNYNFLRATMHRIYYSHGKSALERFHLKSAFDLIMGDPKYAAFENMPISQQIELHSLVRTLVLATDMSRHVELLDSFKAWSAAQFGTQESDGSIENPEESAIDDKGRILLMQILIKVADLSHTLREWSVSRRWSRLMMEEIHQQGIEETNLQLQVSPFMDGSVSAAVTQINFLPLIVIPLLRALVNLPDLAPLKELEQHAWRNLQHWTELTTPTILAVF
ncbi:cAMP-specific phosphodiesterase-4 B [Pelomyxa schiedti]|nr:cAMP-specific phosphodiesterase-4 B [Pelomyxa schiedti]